MNLFGTRKKNSPSSYRRKRDEQDSSHSNGNPGTRSGLTSSSKPRRTLQAMPTARPRNGLGSAGEGALSGSADTVGETSMRSAQRAFVPQEQQQEPPTARLRLRTDMQRQSRDTRIEPSFRGGADQPAESSDSAESCSGSDYDTNQRDSDVFTLFEHPRDHVGQITARRLDVSPWDDSTTPWARESAAGFSPTTRTDNTTARAQRPAAVSRVYSPTTSPTEASRFSPGTALPPGQVWCQATNGFIFQPKQAEGGAKGPGNGGHGQAGWI